jgi:GH24 family phage-related lysozyme (muramidase)
MYLDTTGHVTVGCGRCLETMAAGKTLPFVNRTARLPATPEAIEASFQNVQAAPWGRVARFYRDLSTVDLPPDAIDRILDADVVWFWTELRRLLPDVRGYPDHIQEALLDLAYNLAPAGLLQLESLIAAVKKGDWEVAATLSHRRQVGDERNKEIAGLFLRQETDA